MKNKFTSAIRSVSELHGIRDLFPLPLSVFQTADDGDDDENNDDHTNDDTHYDENEGSAVWITES